MHKIDIILNPVMILIKFQFDPRLFTFCHRSGIRASYIASRESLRYCDMTIVPSIASFKSFKFVKTVLMTFCIRSTSCLRKMFIGSKAPILARLSLTSKALYCGGSFLNLEKTYSINLLKEQIQSRTCLQLVGKQYFHETLLNPSPTLSAAHLKSCREFP